MRQIIGIAVPMRLRGRLALVSENPVATVADKERRAGQRWPEGDKAHLIDIAHRFLARGAWGTRGRRPERAARPRRSSPDAEQRPPQRLRSSVLPRVALPDAPRVVGALLRLEDRDAPSRG